MSEALGRTGANQAFAATGMGATVALGGVAHRCQFSSDGVVVTAGLRCRDRGVHLEAVPWRATTLTTRDFEDTAARRVVGQHPGDDLADVS